MNAEPIRYVPIWSGWHRATHWLFACGVLFELFSGKRYFHVNRQQGIEDRVLNTGIPVDITPGKPVIRNPEEKKLS